MPVQRDDAPTSGRGSRTGERWWRRDHLRGGCRGRGDAPRHDALLADWKLGRGRDDGAVSDIEVPELAGRVFGPLRGGDDGGGGVRENRWWRRCPDISPGGHERVRGP